jgi:hypothetical protein
MILTPQEAKRQKESVEAPKIGDSKITKREVISEDKDGKLEKVYFQKEARIAKRDDGTEYTKIVEPWELRAHGRKLQELRGAFKESAPQMMHEGAKEWERHGGGEVITKPDGTTDTVRADKVAMYRERPGFCVRRIRPGITVDGFGGMKRDGITRMKIRYSNGQRIIEEVK